MGKAVCVCLLEAGGAAAAVENPSAGGWALTMYVHDVMRHLGYKAKLPHPNLNTVDALTYFSGIHNIISIFLSKYNL